MFETDGFEFDVMIAGNYLLCLLLAQFPAAAPTRIGGHLTRVERNLARISGVLTGRGREGAGVNAHFGLRLGVSIFRWLACVAFRHRLGGVRDFRFEGGRRDRLVGSAQTAQIIALLRYQRYIVLLL